MKLMNASDIHGSALYCRRILEAFRREEADRLLLLGDILYHGPRNPLPEGYAPMETANMLNEYKDRILGVRGNCEAEIDQIVLAFPATADYALLDLGKRLVFATHGHVYNEERLPPLRPGDILLHGHTHLPVCREHENYIYLNPGSVTMPKNGTPHSYMTIENGLVLWRDLDGVEFMRFVL